MNSLFIIVGSVLLSGPALPTEQQYIEPGQDGAVEVVARYSNFPEKGMRPGDSELDPSLASLNEIVFLEEEPEINLGFDPQDYLPEDFDPTKRYFDFDSFEFLSNDLEMELGFDSWNYLPEGFDPYTTVVGIQGINFMEDDRVDLGFDPREYLPDGFSPYVFQLDLNSIHFMEDEIELDLGADAKTLLPLGFDPHSNVVAIGSINFMESEEIELGFDTSRYQIGRAHV